VIARTSRDSSRGHAQPPLPARPAPLAPTRAQALLARRPESPDDALGHSLAAAVLARARTKQTTTAPSKTRDSGVKKKGKVKQKKGALATIVTAPARRSARTRHAPNAHDLQIHWTGPDFGAWDSAAGGTSVSAELGPAAGQPVNYGSVPGVSSCTAVNALNAVLYDGKIWIKGHLLNDNLGGEGVSKNLTPMTHTANMQFKGQFESKVKSALDVCYSRASFGLDGRDNYYGVSFAVDVVGQAWPDALEDEVLAVADHVVATASYIQKAGAAAPVPAAAPPSAPALPAGPVVVDCDI